MPQPQSDLVQRVAEAALAPQQQQQAPQPQKPVTDTSGPEPQTDMGTAAAAGSPDTEGDKMAQDAILYELQRPDGTVKKMTPQQINSMMDRYSSLNFQHSQMKPVMDVVSKYIQANPNENPKTIAAKLLDLTRAQQPNAQFGADAERQQQQQAQGAPIDPAALKQWAEENAVAVPPGYEQMMTANNQMTQQMQTMMQMMNKVLASSQGQVNAAAQTNRNAGQSQQQMMMQQIGQNLDRVQSALKLPDDSAQDFMMFAAERGYTEADFLDINLTAKVMKDFQSAMAGPEMEHIRNVAQRRQSYTSAGLGGTPGAGAPQAPAQETPFDRMAQNVMEKKFGT